MPLETERERRRVEARPGADEGEIGESHGGKVESFDFAFGEDDVYLIAELPTNVEASAIALAVAASGAARIKTVVLLTPAEIDRAVKVDVAYRAPGK